MERTADTEEATVSYRTAPVRSRGRSVRQYNSQDDEGQSWCKISGENVSAIVTTRDTNIRTPFHPTDIPWPAKTRAIIRRESEYLLRTAAYHCAPILLSRVGEMSAMPI